MLLSLFGGSDLSLGQGLIYSLLGISIVFLVLAFLILVITIMAKISERKKETKAPVAAPVKEAAPVEKKLAKGSCGGVNLFDVDDRTAAMLMAIVADKTNKPLNELRFISIKEIEE